MLYALLAYHDETVVTGMTRPQDEALMAALVVVKKQLAAEGKLKPYARLMPTTAATSVRFEKDMPVLDGPFAETKEQLLGFYILDCASLDDAIDAARRLAAPRVAAGLGAGCFEIRPLVTGSLDGSPT